MTSQKNKVHFFERLYSELAFSPTPPAVEEILNSINFSRPTHLAFTNLSSGDTLDGSFYLEKNLLVYDQGEAMGLPEIILDVSYARVNTVFRCNEKSGSPIINLSKNQNIYEIVFDEKASYEDWMLKLRRFCVLTNFEKKYQITEIIEKKGDVSECLLEAKMGGNHYSAKKFDKKHLVSTSETSLTVIRLMNEIEILRALRNEKIIHLNEVYETEDSVYLVTDYVHNITLRKMLKAASSTFSITKTKSIMQQILKVLAQMKAKNIVHRNLKPSNIMMENKHNIRIINFGLATYVNGPKANFGICGTPGFIAPEIFHSHEHRVYDDKSDIFSAGCIFFEMLFGYPLFTGSKTYEVSYSNKHFKYSDLIKLVMKEQSSPKPLSIKLGLNLLLKLLHNDPKQRPSAEEALGDTYFNSQENLSSGESTPLTSPERSRSNSPQNSRKVSFNLSASNSSSPRGSFSESASYQESSTLTLYPSRSSLRKSSEDNHGRCLSPSHFGNQPQPKSTQRHSDLFVLQKIDLTEGYQDDEDSYNLLGESSPLSKNYPIQSSRIKKHPNQRI